MNNVWSALSDGTRRQILTLLKKRSMTAGEIADNFSISKPSISHHLNILKAAQLVYCEKQGQNQIYSINTTVFQDILSFFAQLSGHEEDDNEKDV